ncbi:hypothetical protein OS493_034904 [Desmophyllum pertusum]|uniref:Uncharacterized protein n=1 Tax=Desmophyllum pertusum TaxID=174260 RepID=A0A9W9Z6X7_9CNID|nr:hypothetical protein OS493_034904 [Desmophyllum pertusum]
MTSKNVQVSCLLIVILTQVITVTCQNISVPTVSNEGGEPTVPPILDSVENRGRKPSASQPQPISTEAEVSIVSHSTNKILKPTPSAQASTTTTTTTIPKTIQVHEIKASPAAVHKTSSDIEPLPKSSATTTLIMTSHPVVTSSPIVELEMSSKPTETGDVITEDAQQVETPQPQDEATPSTSSSTNDVMRSSETFEIEASPIISEQKTYSTVSSSPTKQILSSLAKEEMATSMSKQTESSSSTKQVGSSQAREEMTSSQASQIVTPSLIVTSPHDVDGEIISKTLQAVTSITVLPSSLGSKKMTPLQPTNTVIASPISSQQIISSSQDEKEALDASMSTDGVKSMTYSLTKGMMTSSQSELIMTSSEASFPPSDKRSSQHIGVMVSPQPTKTMTSSQLLTSSEQTLEGMTSLQPTRMMMSSQLLTSFAALKPTSVEHSTQQLKDMMSLQPNNTMISSSISSSSQIMEAQTSSVANAMTSSLIANAMTSSKLIKDVTSSQALKSTSVQTAFSPLKKPVKSTLILSSSQLADLITSSRPVTVKAVTSSPGTTTPVTPTQDKMTTSSETNAPTKTSVAITTSHPVTHATVDSNGHPTHPTHPTHPAEPTHHGETNTTHKTHGDHMTHGPHATMGYPHEPPVVDASTQDQEKNDDGWQISIYVVCGLLVGIVLFVILMVIRNNRQTRSENLRRERKRSVARERKSSLAALRMVKTEEPPISRVEKIEKRLSMHRPDPEESIPLLHLHIMDGEPAVLNHIDAQDTHPEPEAEPEEPTTSQIDYKPLEA